jgi:flagellar L-ring protein FlgH
MRSERMRQFIKTVFCFSLVVLMAGCSSVGKSLRSLVTGKDSDPVAAKTANMTKFSDSENVRAPASDKQYKRMNRQKFEEEAELKQDAGSLWVMEGQGSYLFAQNQTRVIGDFLNVKIEGAPKAQLQTKVRVISRLLEKLDNGNRGLASIQQNPASATGGAQGAKGGQPGGDKQGGGETQGGGSDQAAGAAADAGKQNDQPFAVPVVPTRIVEQLRDGSYRVRGMHPFMIGKREYKVIVTGIIRPEDFNDQGVDASRLLDPQFDIVSSRKGATL